MPLFSPEQTAVGALLLFRVSALVWSAPLFSGRAVPTQLKVGILAVLTILLYPAALTSYAEGIQVNPSTVLGELTVGLLLGLGAGLFIAAAESAGDMVAVQMGLSGANVLNPISSTQMPILGQFLGLFVLTLILSVGGDRIILSTLGFSLDVAPLGSALRLQEGIRAFVLLGGSLFLLGLRFAAPVIAAMMVGNAALGVMARTVPQLNVLTVAFPLQIAIGLFALAASLPLFARFFAGFGGRYEQVWLPTLQTVAPITGGL